MLNRVPNRNKKTFTKKPHNKKPFNKKRVVKEALPADQVKIVLFNKPFDVLCQFTDDQNRSTLADFVKEKGVYAAGDITGGLLQVVFATSEGARAGINVNKYVRQIKSK